MRILRREKGNAPLWLKFGFHSHSLTFPSCCFSFSFSLCLFFFFLSKSRPLVLMSLDDGYSPLPARANAASLIGLNVFALIGSVGTPTADAMLPLLTEARLPLVGAFTGARFLRTPHKPYVLNVRASYDDELASLVDWSLKQGLTRLSIFYQNDAYGMAGFNALDVALKNKGLSIQSQATYERNTLDVDEGISKLQGKIRPQVRTQQDSTRQGREGKGRKGRQQIFLDKCSVIVCSSSVFMCSPSSSFCPLFFSRCVFLSAQLEPLLFLFLKSVLLA